MSPPPLAPLPETAPSAASGAPTSAAELSATPPVRYFAATVVGDAEPALLARLMQRLLCQSAEVVTLRYDVIESTRQAEIEIVFRAEPARARLLARRWESVVAVQKVELRAALVAVAGWTPL